MNPRSTTGHRVIASWVALAMCLAATGTSAAAADDDGSDPSADTVAETAPPTVADPGPWGLVAATAEALHRDPLVESEPEQGPEHAALLALAASWDAPLLGTLATADATTRGPALTAALGPSGPSGAVLLRNDGLLPLPPDSTVVLVDAAQQSALPAEPVGPTGRMDQAGPAEVTVVLVRAELPETPAPGVPVPETQVDPAQVAQAPVPEAQLELVRRVTAANPRTVVVLLGPAAVPTAPWDQDVAALVHLWDGDHLWQDPTLDTDRVTALLRDGSAPTGRLPVAMPDPRYPLGYGLTYTTFEYADLRTTSTPADGPPGGARHTAVVDVTNTGSAPGTETVQVYAGHSPADGAAFGPSGLAGWAQVTLEPGQTQAVTVPLDGPAVAPDAPSEPDAVPGRRELHVGSSAGDLRLHGTLELAPTTGAAGPAEPTPTTVAPATDASPGAGPTTVTDPGARTTAPAPEHGANRPATRVAPSAPTGALRLTVTPGTLTLTGAERLPDRLRLQGTLPTVTVQDGRQERTGRGGWTVSGQFTDLSGSQHALSADRLGWEPHVVDAGAGLTAGPPVPTSLSGGPGLVDAAVLASADARAPSGPTALGATVRLEVPAGTPAGSYGGTVTLTLFPTE